MQTIEYPITGMTCGGCVKRVKETLMTYAQQVEVTLNPPIAKLTNPVGDITALNHALAKVGHYQLQAPTKQAIQHDSTDETQPWFATYKPLLLVFAYLLLVTLLAQVSRDHFSLTIWMRHFMAGFFLVFSFFKLLDIRGFSSSYAMYDLLAKRLPSYGLLYPFIELILGIWYLSSWQPVLVNYVTLFVMGFSTIGVIMAVASQQPIRCACLGTGFNLPMSTITIIEDLAMVLMAAWMLIFT